MFTVPIFTTLFLKEKPSCSAAGISINIQKEKKNEIFQFLKSHEGQFYTSTELAEIFNETPVTMLAILTALIRDEQVFVSRDNNYMRYFSYKERGK